MMILYWTVVSTIFGSSCARICALQMSIFVSKVKLLNAMVLHGYLFPLVSHKRSLLRFHPDNTSSWAVEYKGHFL